MAHCPFCKGPVNEDLLRFGGNCPSCLILIPGEEAATDPGEEKRAAEDDAHRKQAAARERRRHRIIGGLVALVVGGVAVAILTREPPPTPLALDTEEFYIVPLDAHQSQAAMETPAELASANGSKATKTAGSGSRASSSSSASAGSSSSGGASTDAGASAPEATVASAGASSPSSGVSSGSSSADLFSVALNGPKAKSANLTLKDDSAIAKMVMEVFNAGTRQLRGCYESSLKENPSLRGSWEVSWVVTKEGRAKDVEARARGAGDRDLEGCMERTVASWKFQPVYTEFAIPARTVIFGSGG